MISTISPSVTYSAYRDTVVLRGGAGAVSLGEVAGTVTG